MEKLISLIVTVYNKEIYLGHCFMLLNQQLLSLNEQERSKIELLVIDDCSTDGSIDLIKNIMDGSLNYRIIHNEERKRIAYVRWQAVNEVQGKYFIFIDADDLINENYIRMLLDVNFNMFADVYQFKGREYPNGVLMGFESTWSPLKLIKTSFVRKHNINYDKNMLTGVEGHVGGEDSDFYEKLIAYKPIIVNIDKVLITWNFAVPDSITKVNYSYLNWISKE